MEGVLEHVSFVDVVHGERLASRDLGDALQLGVGLLAAGAEGAAICS